MTTLAEKPEKVARVVPNAPWPMTTLGRIVSASTEKVDPLDKPNAPYIGLEHIERDVGTISGQGIAADVKSTKAVFRKGDLLYGKLRPYLNKVWVAQFDGVCSTDILVFPKSESVDNSFLKYRFMASDFVRFASENSNGVNLPRVNSKALSRFPLWLPQIDDQRRIVAEIEQQFTRLDAGVAALRRTQANLKRYRAAVLKAACEGRLVPTEAELARENARVLGSIPTGDFDSPSHGSNPQARKRGSIPRGGTTGVQEVVSSGLTSPTNYETGEQLLTRVLVERRESYKGRGKYSEPVEPDTTGLPELPEGWTWSSLDQLLGLMRNGISAKPDAESGLPILRISAVRALSVDINEARFLNAVATDYPDYSLAEGDILFTRYNGNPELVGVCGVVPPLMSPLVHPDKLIRCKVVPSGAHPDFVAIMSNVGESRAYLAKRVRTTAGQAGISGGDLKGLPIPLAPAAEQTRIVAEVERRLSVVDELESIVKSNLQRAIRFRQSILQKAFSGQ